MEEYGFLFAKFGSVQHLFCKLVGSRDIVRLAVIEEHFCGRNSKEKRIFNRYIAVWTFYQSKDFAYIEG